MTQFLGLCVDAFNFPHQLSFRGLREGLSYKPKQPKWPHCSFPGQEGWGGRGASYLFKLLFPYLTHGPSKSKSWKNEKAASFNDLIILWTWSLEKNFNCGSSKISHTYQATSLCVHGCPWNEDWPCWTHEQLNSQAGIIQQIEPLWAAFKEVWLLGFWVELILATDFLCDFGQII